MASLIVIDVDGHYSVILYVFELCDIFGPGRRVPESHSNCFASCCYQLSKDPKIPKAFLIRSGAQRNFAYTFVLTLPTDLPSQISHLFSN